MSDRRDQDDSCVLEGAAILLAIVAKFYCMSCHTGNCLSQQLLLQENGDAASRTSTMASSWYYQNFQPIVASQTTLKAATTVQLFQKG